MLKKTGLGARLQGLRSPAVVPTITISILALARFNVGQTYHCNAPKFATW